MTNSAISWDTPTMAELYVSQGDIDRAVYVYRKIVKEQPNNIKYRNRLIELEKSSQKDDQQQKSVFTKKLGDVVDQVPGCISCMLMGFDGICVENYQSGYGSTDLVSIVVEYSAMMINYKRVADEHVSVGNIEEFIISSKGLTIIIHPINSEYFIALTLENEIMLGKARFLLKVMEKEIITEL